MDIYDLPDFLNAKKGAHLHAYDYKVTSNLNNGMVNLKMNAISFLQHGTKEVTTDLEKSSIDNSSFLMMRSGKCLMTEKTASNNLYHSTLLFFSDNRITRFIHDYDIPVTSKPDFESHQICKYDAFIINWVHGLQRITQMKNGVKEKLINLKFEELMLYLFEKGTLFSFLTAAAHSEKSHNHFTSVIERSVLAKLSVQELAFLCNMSVSSFKREFKKHYNKAPIKWFQEKRLNHAAHLISKQGLRPNEVYFLVGYENASSFSQAFKKHFGQSPKAYQG